VDDRDGLRSPRGEAWLKMNPHVPYDPEQHLEPAREMMRRGATLLELADYFGVPTASVQLWALCHGDFAEVLRVGRELADERVELALYNRCVGYTFDSVKLLVVDKSVVHEKYREHVPPDAGSALKWLSSRRPEQWRDKREGEDEGGVVTVVIERVKINLDEAQGQTAAAARESGGGSGSDRREPNDGDSLRSALGQD
jgi:hypothetical protein